MWEDRRLRDITEADIRQIVDAQLEEHLQLEYKSALYDNNHQGSKESLLDICMFANAGGGILLLGVSEQRDANQQPTGLPDPNAQLGIDILNPETVLQAYDARVIASVQERLPLESYAIPVANDRHLLAIRVPNSMSKPHRVFYQGHAYFPSRRERQRYEMDVREIKEMAMRTASRLEEAQERLTDSFQEIGRQVAVPDLLICVTPVFRQNFMVDMQKPEVLRAVTQFHLGNNYTVQPKFTFDGLERQILGKEFSFVRIHRDGLIAAKIELPIRVDRGVSMFRPSAIDIFLRSFVGHSTQVYSSVPINGPFLLCMMLRTGQNLQSLYPAVEGAWEEYGGRVNTGDYPFPVMEADTLVGIDKVIRPLCDQAHQMFGRASSPCFDDEGVWSHRG
jgi:Putative DNA-binding domain